MEDKKAPFPSGFYKPAYLPSDQAIAIGDASLSEPIGFFLSFGARLDGAAQEKRQPLNQPKGFIEITSIRITLPKRE